MQIADIYCEPCVVYVETNLYALASVWLYKD
jgi:TPP-dependent pyruvate/acetoin dehydrogenase alpha subunit